MTAACVEASLAPFLADLNQLCPHWAVFGSAALALCGVEGVEVHDVDVLVDTRSAQAFEGLWAHRLTFATAEPGPLFSSRLSRYTSPALPLELSGGLHILHQGSWQPVVLAPDEIAVTPQGIRHCSLPACRRLLTLFARPRDLAHLALCHD